MAACRKMRLPAGNPLGRKRRAPPIMEFAIGRAAASLLSYVM
jgi:hypothetical protein